MAAPTDRPTFAGGRARRPTRGIADQVRGAADLAAAAADGRTAAPVQVHLRDGTPVVLRPVRPADAERVARGFAQLSATSRYLRFHFVVSETLTPGQLHAVTHVDHRRHAVWVALEAGEAHSPVVGVASYVAVPEQPSVAEAAIAVVDRLQGRGLGTALLHVLVDVARSNDIEVLRSYVLTRNATMLHILDDLGAQRARLPHGVEVVDLVLPPPGGDLVGTCVHRVMRTAAERSPQPLLSGRHPLLWVRRHRRPGPERSLEDGAADVNPSRPSTTRGT